jgi:hypothetical protein
VVVAEGMVLHGRRHTERAVGADVVAGGVLEIVVFRHRIFFEFCKVAEGKGLGVVVRKVAETKELGVKVAETEDLRMTSRMVRRTVAGMRIRQRISSEYPE